MVSGKKIVLELLKKNPPEYLTLFYERNASKVEGFSGGDAYEGQVNSLEFDGPLFKQLDIFGTHFPLLKIKIPEFRSFQEYQGVDDPGVVLPLQDPGNIGAAIRSARAFGIKNFVLTKESSNPFHPKSLRASSGAVFGAQFFSTELNLNDFLAENSSTHAFVFLDSQGEDLRTYKFPKRFLMVPGVEGPGLPQSVKRENCVRISIEKDVESLNAMISVSIALYEWSSRG
jgi:tRNA G18 (ribose-2'-O)-methylase SpoU